MTLLTPQMLDTCWTAVQQPPDSLSGQSPSLGASRIPPNDAAPALAEVRAFEQERKKATGG